MRKNIDIAALGELLIDLQKPERAQMVCVCLNRIRVALLQIC